MKSLRPASEDTAKPSQHNAVLCTENQTFNIRQVQSSNSVFLVKPFERSLDTRGSSSATCVRAVAQCTATLELTPISVDCISIFKQILPIYNVSSDGAENYDYTTLSELYSKEVAFEHTPLSRHQFADTWRNTCAFEFQGVAFLPSAACLASVWRSIMSSSISNCLNITEKFRTISLIDAVEEHGFPTSLVNAVLKRVAVDSGDPINGCMSFHSANLFVEII